MTETQIIDRSIKRVELNILSQKLELMEVKVMRFRLWWLEELKKLATK